MKGSFDEQLRQALCRVEPSEGFAQRVLERMDRRRSERRIWYGAVAAGLAVLLSAGGIGLKDHEQRLKLAEQTQRQVVFALSLAAEKVDRANARLQESAPELDIRGKEGGQL